MVHDRAETSRGEVRYPGMAHCPGTPRGTLPGYTSCTTRPTPGYAGPDAAVYSEALPPWEAAQPTAILDYVYIYSFSLWTRRRLVSVSSYILIQTANQG